MKYDRWKGGNKGMKENRDGKHKCRVKKEFWKIISGKYKRKRECHFKPNDVESDMFKAIEPYRAIEL